MSKVQAEERFLPLSPLSLVLPPTQSQVYAKRGPLERLRGKGSILPPIKVTVKGRSVELICKAGKSRGTAMGSCCCTNPNNVSAVHLGSTKLGVVLPVSQT